MDCKLAACRDGGIASRCSELMPLVVEGLGSTPNCSA